MQIAAKLTRGAPHHGLYTYTAEALRAFTYLIAIDRREVTLKDCTPLEFYFSSYLEEYEPCHATDGQLGSRRELKVTNRSDCSEHPMYIVTEYTSVFSKRSGVAVYSAIANTPATKAPCLCKHLTARISEFRENT